MDSARKGPSTEPRHLRLYMKCQLCLHEWSVEGYGLLYDMMLAIEGCPSTDRDCQKTLDWTKRPSLQALKHEVIENPHAVVGELDGREDWTIKGKF